MVIEVERDARGVMTLWLSREEVHNAMNAEMMDAIADLVSGLKPGGDVRVLVLAGRGKSFCAGGDLGWMRSQFEATADERTREGRRLADMLYALYALDIPVIGRIHGNAFGGGVGMASICDVAVGVRGRSLGLTETRLGLIPATIGPYVAAKMGPKLKQVFMSARVFSAEEAVELGILGKAVDADDLDTAVEAEVAPYLSCAPGAVAEAKALARRLGPTIDDSLLATTILALTARWESEETAQGVGAFFAKEKPPWLVE
ncbi:MAG: crotonase/enoyl-CoA hydratase family protein [Pseudomonadota bacterium]